MASQRIQEKCSYSFFYLLLSSRCLESCSSLSYRLFNGLNGVKIENQGKQSMLVFFNVSEEDYGNYTCVAMNTMGITNASIILYGKNINAEYKKGSLLLVSMVIMFKVLYFIFKCTDFSGCFFAC